MSLLLLLKSSEGGPPIGRALFVEAGPDLFVGGAAAAEVRCGGAKLSEARGGGAEVIQVVRGEFHE